MKRGGEEREEMKAPELVAQPYIVKNGAITTPVSVDRRFNLADIEQRTIDEAVAYCNGNITHASAMLGINRRTTQRKYSRKEHHHHVRTQAKTTRLS